jgi:hypothetical protein
VPVMKKVRFIAVIKAERWRNGKHGQLLGFEEIVGLLA